MIIQRISHGSGPLLLECCLIKTTKRITFEISFQSIYITNEDENSIKSFVARNGYDVISEHRMDIQSYRIWLHGAANDQPATRSGTMAIPTQKMTDETFPEYIEALKEWADYNLGKVEILAVDFTNW